MGEHGDAIPYVYGRGYRPVQRREVSTSATVAARGMLEDRWRVFQELYIEMFTAPINIWLRDLTASFDVDAD